MDHMVVTSHVNGDMTNIVVSMKTRPDHVVWAGQMPTGVYQAILNSKK